jgi:hypothetical protein
MIRRDLARAGKSIRTARDFLLLGDYANHNRQLEQAIHHLRSAMIVEQGGDDGRSS